MFLCCLKALELRRFASLCDSPILPFDNAIIAQIAFTAQGDVKGKFKKIFAPTPPPLGTDPAKPLILLAQTAFRGPGSRNLESCNRARESGRTPPSPAPFPTPPRHHFATCVTDAPWNQIWSTRPASQMPTATSWAGRINWRRASIVPV